jgi:glutamine amidotransferase
MLNSKRILVIDTGISNIKSLIGALKYLKVEYQVINKPTNDLNNEENSIILPGVGSFSEGSEKLESMQFFDYIQEAHLNQVQILGICLGMQLLCRASDEGSGSKGLSLFDCELKKFSFDKGSKVLQHVGFNVVESHGKEIKLLSGIPDSSDFYFTHSYMIPVNSLNFEVGFTENAKERFVSIISNGTNLHGVQFHPEKSQTNGLKLLKNFIQL